MICLNACVCIAPSLRRQCMSHHRVTHLHPYLDTHFFANIYREKKYGCHVKLLSPYGNEPASIKFLSRIFFPLHFQNVFFLNYLLRMSSYWLKWSFRNWNWGRCWERYHYNAVSAQALHELALIFLKNSDNNLCSKLLGNKPASESLNLHDVIMLILSRRLVW